MRTPHSLIRALPWISPVLLMLAPLPLAAQVVYAPTDLGTVGGTDSEAYAINDYGQVVGRSLDVDGKPTVFQWQSGEMIAIYHESIWGRLTLPTAEYSVSYGVSDTDHIISTILSQSPDDTNLLCESSVIFRPGVMSDLSTPYPGDAIDIIASHISSASQISANGLYVVGWATQDPSSTRITGYLVTPVDGLWADPATGPCGPQNPYLKNLGTLRARDENSSATSVNNRGQVVGWSYTWYPSANKAGYAAFLIEAPLDTDADGEPDEWYVDDNGANALMLELGTLGGHNSWARDINFAGFVVGESDTANWHTHAFLWSPVSRTMQNLGTLGGDSSSAAAINDVGEVVGWSLNANGNKHAFFIAPNDTDADGQPDQWYVDADGDGINDLMVDLNTVLTSGSKLTLSEARDINVRGHIVGWGSTGTSADANRHAFLLKPTTETGDNTQAVATHADATLAPVEAQPTDGSDQDNTDPSDGSSTAPALGPLHFLCGVGLTNMLPFLLAGLVGLKWGVRRW
jgi:probable HAF family extracellular repeat protein